MDNELVKPGDYLYMAPKSWDNCGSILNHIHSQHRTLPIETLPRSQHTFQAKDIHTSSSKYTEHRDSIPYFRGVGRLNIVGAPLPP